MKSIQVKWHSILPDLLAFKDAMAKAYSVLLEPIAKVEVTMPEEYGDVIGDINARRGRIEGMDDLGVVDRKSLHSIVRNVWILTDLLFKNSGTW